MIQLSPPSRGRKKHQTNLHFQIHSRYRVLVDQWRRQSPRRPLPRAPPWPWNKSTKRRSAQKNRAKANFLLRSMSFSSTETNLSCPMPTFSTHVSNSNKNQTSTRRNGFAVSSNLPPKQIQPVRFNPFRPESSIFRLGDPIPMRRGLEPIFLFFFSRSRRFFPPSPVPRLFVLQSSNLSTNDVFILW
jgi:hypothetical protein